jgi:tetratricopeptide (TPR) repeat protein
MARQFTDPKRANDYARQHLALVPALLKQFPGNDDVADQAAAAHATMSALLERSGDREQALKEAVESASIREGVAARHPNDTFRLRLLMIAYGHVGGHLGEPFAPNVGDSKQSREYYDKCVAIARRIVTADPQDRTAQYDLANALLRQGGAEVPHADHATSLAALRESSEILESLSREDPSALRYQRPLSAVYQYLGTCLREMGRFNEALDELKLSTAVADATMVTHPGDTPSLGRIVRNESDSSAILISRHDLTGALTHAQRGLSVAQKYADGPEQGLRFRYLGNAYNSVAAVDRALGKWQDAHDHAQLAIDNWSRPEVKDVDPASRQQATAVLSEAASHLPRK